MILVALLLLLLLLNCSFEDCIIIEGTSSNNIYIYLKFLFLNKNCEMNKCARTTQKRTSSIVKIHLALLLLLYRVACDRVSCYLNKKYMKFKKSVEGGGRRFSRTTS